MACGGCQERGAASVAAAQAVVRGQWGEAARQTGRFAASVRVDSARLAAAVAAAARRVVVGAGR